jgi:inward rectifier potassium channel
MQERLSAKMYQGTAVSPKELRDLGFGSVVAGESRLRLLNQDGSFNVHRKGLSEYALRNLYHWLLTMKWWNFLGVVVLVYLGINLVFAGLFLLCGEGALFEFSKQPIQNVFLRAFFFSVHTFGTIGYGTISPVGTLANILVTVESIVSILLQALVTGMIFARFSRPTPKIKFSNKAVVAPYQDGKGFMFRLVNLRISQLIEVEVQVLLARFVNENGRIVRRFEFLNLEREKVTFFPLAWTVVHPIVEESPLYNVTEQDLITSDAEILILITAIDEGFSQTVHTRTSYKPEEIFWNAKFKSIYNKMGNEEPISINIHKLSEIEKV